MIRYTLKCSNGHSFESWFKSADAYDALADSKLVACPDCGASEVGKSLMAPRVRPAKSSASANVPATSQSMTTQPDPKVAEAIRSLRTHVEENSDYVGDRFAAEARSMHVGDTPERAIYGQAQPDDARKLIEDGIPAMPLPFIPRQKTN